MFILVLLSLILGGYSIFLIRKVDKKINKRINTSFNTLKFNLHEKSLYLLDELNNKTKNNEKLLLKKIKETNNLNQKDNNIKHEQLIYNEFKKLRSDINKDLNSIVESVKNTKIL